MVKAVVKRFNNNNADRRNEMNHQFDYSKLKGKIVEKYGTNQAFAAAMGWSFSTNGKKLSQKARWDQDEILRACSLLEIDHGDILDYFFRLAS